MSTMSIRLAGWQAHGLRCPDHLVSFEKIPGETHPISLLQMPNGTGKTTTLKLLRASLSGMGPGGRWKPEEIRDMRKDDATQSGRFQVSLLYNTQRVTFTLDFDFDEPSVRQSTTLSTGNREGFQPPRELTRFLNESFVNFFVFDGELADSLLDKTKTNAQQVIDDLFQLHLFDRIQNWVDKYWKDESAKQAKNGGSSAQTEKGLNRLRSNIDRHEKRLTFLKSEYGKLITDQERNKNLQIRLRNANDAAIKSKKEFEGRLNDAELSLDTAQKEVDHLSVKVLGMMRNPHAISPTFGRDMVELKDSLDKVKLPESAAREFFEDLAKEDTCVCGRPLDSHTKQAVRDRAKHYLGSEDVSLLNQIKGEVSAQVDDIETAPQELEEQMKRLQRAIKEVSRLRSVRDAVKAEAVGDDPELEKKEKEILRLSEDLGRINKELERFESNEQGAEVEQTWSITVIEKGLDDCKNKFAQLANTLRLKARSELVQQILSTARADSRTRISQALCEQANERVKQLMPSNRIQIDRIERSLRLAGGKSGGSAGETLAVAYAFLSTLFHRSDYQLPFVVDSPAGPLDHPKRAAVASIIPQLTGQFVAFTISTERDGFQDKLEAAQNIPIQYLTLFRAGDIAMDGAVAVLPNVIASTDGYLVPGREFFESFQIDSEVN